MVSRTFFSRFSKLIWKEVALRIIFYDSVKKIVLLLPRNEMKSIVAMEKIYNDIKI